MINELLADLIQIYVQIDNTWDISWAIIFMAFLGIHFVSASKYRFNEPLIDGICWLANLITFRDFFIFSFFRIFGKSIKGSLVKDGNEKLLHRL